MKLARVVTIIVLSASIAHGGEVLLRRSNPAGARLSAWPVTVAVPFPPGELAGSDPVLLVGPGGRPVPAQFRILTKWWGLDDSVQTLLVNFIADTAAAEYRLRYGARGAVAAPEQPVKVVEKEDSITVETGPLRAVIAKDRFRLFDSLSFRGSQVCSPSGGLWQGELTSAAAPPESVSVEESGPVRAVIAVRGRYAGAGGVKGLSYLVRIHFFAGLPVVRVEYTFIQDSGKVFVDVPSFSMDVRLPPGRRKVEFGLPDGTAKTFDYGSSDELSLVQVGPEQPETIRGLDYAPFKDIIAERKRWWSKEEEALWERDERRKEFKAAWTLNGKTVAAEKSSGWVRISPEGKPWAMTARVRWFWQLHPKGIFLEGDRLRFFMYPRLERPLHLHLGTAKTHTIFLAFHDRGDDGASKAYRDAFEEPPMYFPTPQWMCASRVWGEIPPVTPGRFRYFEERVAEWIERTYRDGVEKTRAYGMMDFGDHLYGGGQWNNMETAEDYGIFIEFVRTGERKFFDAFERAVYHFRDVDVSHGDLTEGRFDYGLWLMPGYMPEKLARECAVNDKMRSEMFYYLGDQPPPKGGIRRHSFRHFGNAGFHPVEFESKYEYKRGKLYGGTCTVGGHGWNIGVIAHYMFTGDRYSYEVAELTGSLIMRKLTPNNWGRDNWKNVDVVHLYKMTGREDYRRQARQAIDFFHENRGRITEKVELQRAPRNRALMSPWYTIGNFIRDYYDLTRDAEVARKFVDMVDVWIDAVEKTEVDSSCGPIFSYIRDYKDSRCHGDFADLAYACKITGKRDYVDRGLASFKVYMHHAYHSTALFEIPKVLYVLSKLGVDPLDQPYTPAVRGGATVKAFVDEGRDGDFTVYVAQTSGFRVDAEPVHGWIRLVSPSGRVAAEKKITMTGLDYFELHAPKDSETGIYTVQAEAPKLLFELSCDLPISRHRPARAVRGRFGGAVELVDCARLRYRAAGNVPFEQGTIEMMVKPLWPDPKERDRDVPYHYHQLFDSRDREYDQGITIYLWDSGRKGAQKSLIAAWAEVDKAENISVPCSWKKGEWHRIAFTWKRAAEGKGEMAFYVDGECVGRNENAPNFPTRPYRPDDVFVIGVNSTDSSNTSLTGVVDWIRISDIVRTTFPDSQPAADEHTTFLATFDGSDPLSADRARDPHEMSAQHLRK